MEKEVYVVIASALGAFSVLAASFITGRNQASAANTNALRDIELERLKYENEAKLKVATRVLKRLEKAHVHLSQISQAFDLTGTVMKQTAGTTIPEFDRFYHEHLGRLNEIRMLLDFYAQSPTVDPKALAGVMSNYWGNFRNFVYQNEQGNKDAKQRALDKVIDYAHQVASQASSLQEAVSDFARQLRL